MITYDTAWLGDAYDVYHAARVVVVTPPAIEPLTAADVMAERRNDDDTDMAGIERRITTARQRVESDTGRALITQTLDLYFDRFPCGSTLLLPMPTLQSVTTVTTYDLSNVATVWSSSNYYLDTASEPGRLVLASGSFWPTDLRDVNAIIVRVVAGYGTTAATVPAALRSAMHLLIGQYDEQRENVLVSQFAGQLIELPQGYDTLIAPYRLWIH